MGLLAVLCYCLILLLTFKFGPGIEQALRLRPDQNLLFDRGNTGEVIQRGIDAALVKRYPGSRQAHLDPAQRAGQHQVIKIAEMADAKNAALDFCQASTERHIESLQDQIAQMIGIVTVGHQHRVAAERHRGLPVAVSPRDRQDGALGRG